MRRTACRVDGNQAEVISALQSAGASVECLHMLGRGVPDLLIGYGGQNYLFEVKDGDKSPSARRLSPDETIWHRTWRGQVTTVESVLEALSAIANIHQDTPHLSETNK